MLNILSNSLPTVSTHGYIVLDQTLFFSLCVTSSSSLWEGERREMKGEKGGSWVRVPSPTFFFVLFFLGYQDSKPCILHRNHS